jgi:methionyl-tRNA formyltransferase
MPIQLSDLRIVFMGTPDFAVPTLDALVGLGCQVVGVVSQPDRRKGRGRKVARTPVAACADTHNIPVHQWPRLNNDSYATLKALAPDVCVVVAYGKILPQRYLDLPQHGCINGHASLLPTLRGAAPIQWAVIRGHGEAGTTIMRMDAGMDTGDMGAMVRVAVGPDETAGGLHDRLSQRTAEAMAQTMRALCAGTQQWTPQDHSGATMAPMLQKTDGLIDWSWPAQQVHDRVRGTAPWPGAYVPRPGGPLKIHGTRIAEGSGAPGTVIAHDSDGPRIACGEGAVTLLTVQRPGKKPVPGAAFLNGADLPLGSAL